MSLESDEHILRSRIAELRRREVEILYTVYGPLRDYWATEAEIEVALAKLSDVKIKKERSV